LEGDEATHLQAWTKAVSNRTLSNMNLKTRRGKLPFPGVEIFGPSQWAEAVKGADAVVNLAGTPIGTRWAPPA
jgi:NAD dependent epimerase/dehydratase family enzyme